MIHCNECQFSVCNLEQGVYECRRYPPQMIPIPQMTKDGPVMQVRYLFPIVGSTQWCGEGKDDPE